MNTLHITAVIFKRERLSKEEFGVIFNSGEGVIIDMDGQPVKALWSWTARMDELSVTFRPVG